MDLFIKKVFSPNGELVQTRTFENREKKKKNELQAIFLLFELASSLTEVFWGASDLLDASCRHVHSPLPSKKCVI